MDNINGHLFEFGLTHTQGDTGETLAQRPRRNGMFGNNTGPPPERRSTISTMVPSSYNQSNNTRMRNLSGGSNGSTASGSSTGSSTQLDNQYSDNQLGYFKLEIGPCNNITSTSAVPASSRGSSSSSHRKLDRSWSDSDNDRNGSHRSVNSSRYKTELCRPFEESGSCKYGDKCQFAHGYHELRNLARHPKYKTELCRTFHTVGFCPYGPRCHFIHEDESKPGDASPKLGRSSNGQAPSTSSSPSLSPSGSDEFNVFSYQAEVNQRAAAAVNVENRQVNSLTVNINYGNFTAQELNRFSSLNLNDNSNIFSANNNKGEAKMTGTAEERDIFSEITMFNSAEVLDNTPKPSMHNMKLDNFPSFKDSPIYWPASYAENYFSQMMRPNDHSPTGSDGSNSSRCSTSGSDCGGSTESLASAGFTEFRCPVAIGQY